MAHHIWPGLIVQGTPASRARLTNLCTNFSRECFRGIMHLCCMRSGLRRTLSTRTNYPPGVRFFIVCSAGLALLGLECRAWCRCSTGALSLATEFLTQLLVSFPSCRAHTCLYPLWR